MRINSEAEMLDSVIGQSRIFNIHTRFQSGLKILWFQNDYPVKSRKWRIYNETVIPPPDNTPTPKYPEVSAYFDFLKYKFCGFEEEVDELGKKINWGKKEKEFEFLTLNPEHQNSDRRLIMTDCIFPKGIREKIAAFISDSKESDDSKEKEQIREKEAEWANMPIEMKAEIFKRRAVIMELKMEAEAKAEAKAEYKARCAKMEARRKAQEEAAERIKKEKWRKEEENWQKKVVAEREEREEREAAMNPILREEKRKNELEYQKRKKEVGLLVIEKLKQ